MAPSSFLAGAGGSGRCQYGSSCRRSGAKVSVKLTTHVLRHSYATHLLAGGADVRHVQRLLGHKDLTTTALYTKVDTTELRRMINRHPREKNLARCSRRV